MRPVCQAFDLRERGLRQSRSNSRPADSTRPTHDVAQTRCQAPLLGMVPWGPSQAFDLRKHQWGRSGLNRRPTDYESDQRPHATIPIRRFVRGSLTLADSEEQRFSLLCATNVPQDLRGSWSAGAWIDHHRITKSGPVFANGHQLCELNRRLFGFLQSA